MRRLSGLLVALLVILTVPTTSSAAPMRPAMTTPRLISHYRVTPGVIVSSYRRVVAGQKIRYDVMRVAWRVRGVGLALVQPPYVDQVQPLNRMLTQTPNAVAGVNGDFFDLDKSGAPIGMGISGGQVQHGATSGWNSAFWVGPRGRPWIGTEPLAITSPQYPDLGLTNLDSPQVQPGGIGVYDAHWRTTDGYAWTGGQETNVLTAQVINGQVVGFQPMVPAGQPIVGLYVVARGARAVRRLRTLQVGSAFSINTAVASAAQIAVTGDGILLQNDVVVADGNPKRDPRTAVGIDYKHQWLFFVVVDGREKNSTGVSLVQLAQMLRGLGCTEALNLDGGASSTLIARRRGRLRVINTPSDGKPRKVANGLAITYAGSVATQ